MSPGVLYKHRCPLTEKISPDLTPEPLNAKITKLLSPGNWNIHIINRPGVAGAVLHTASSLIN